MNTPICDFVKNYIEKEPARLHMPGHKGTDYLGYERYDITEIDGADSLYEASGIICESEKNASSLFGCDTFYSAEGSTQCIKAMVYLTGIYAQKINRKKLILAGRNAHRSFVSAVCHSGFDVEWLYSEDDCSYISCTITSDMVENALKNAEELPVAVYITSPDYLGNIQDIKSISDVCKRYNVLLLCDNAHGVYLKFLKPSMHPVDLGADMCCDSAHKTLPALTGAAYLHLGDIGEILSPYVRNALSLFGSTSPNYLILQSLDYLNKYLWDGYQDKLKEFSKKVLWLKNRISHIGYEVFGDEVLKITIKTDSYGYRGDEIAKLLKEKDIICEFYDRSFVVLMLTPEISDDIIERIFESFCRIEKREPLISDNPCPCHHAKKMSIRDAVMSDAQEVLVDDAEGRILSQLTVACPPAVLIAAPGEEITKEDIKVYKSIGTKTLFVVKK